MTQLVFHVTRSWLSFGGTGLAPFYVRLLDGLKDRDVSFEIEMLDRDRLPDRVEQDIAIHVVHHGRFAHPRVR
ncbi:MAG: hypothetical protein AAF252_10510, partial [Pseudomonadota bacterium]